MSLRLSFLDLAFFITESKVSPKHVGGISIFKKPARAKASWVKEFYEESREHSTIKAPFNHVINFRSLGGPSWRVDESADISNHLVYHKPKKTLNKQQLFDYVAKLHEPLMDRSKPLWEFHIIDNMEGNRFAMYTKFHHSMADGVTLSRWMMHNTSATAKGHVDTPVWAHGNLNETETRKNRAESRGLFRKLANSTNQWKQILGGTTKLMTQLALEEVGLTKNAVALPFKASEKSPLTGAITKERQCRSASLDMGRILKLRKATRCTLNHIALTCIDGALHRYLKEEGVALDRPLSVQMPVNLRSQGDNASGNKIGIVLVDMAPITKDPYERLREIGFTLRAVRNQIDSVPSVAVAQYTAVLAVLLELIDLLKLSKYLPSVADTLVSNVPGPASTLYMNGAKLEQSFPMSTLVPGTQLNITLYSYDGTLYLGLISTPKVKHLDNLCRYIEEAFVDLEHAVYSTR